MPFEWIRTVLTEYQPLQGRFRLQFPLLSPTPIPVMLGGTFLVVKGCNLLNENSIAE